MRGRYCEADYRPTAGGATDNMLFATRWNFSRFSFNKEPGHTLTGKLFHVTFSFFFLFLTLVHCL